MESHFRTKGRVIAVGVKRYREGLTAGVVDRCNDAVAYKTMMGGDEKFPKSRCGWVRYCPLQ
jgi:hypothetical protein